MEKLYLKKEVSELIYLVKKIQISLVEQGEKYINVIIPGYTHLRAAQYIPFSHYLMSFFWPLAKSRSRLEEALKRLDKLPLGSGALAGSTVPLDREFLRRELGFSSVTENSIEAIAIRNFILGFFSILLFLSSI